MTYGRCPDGTGDFVVTSAASKGAANVCVAGDVPMLDPHWADIEINEISSLNAGQEGATFSDAVEPLPCR